MNVISTLNEYKLTDDQILNVYLYGSRVYGCYVEDSDYDYIAVVDGINIDTQIIKDDINICIYSLDVFEKMLDEHHVAAVECMYLKSEYIIKERIKFTFNPDLQKLRESFSKIASNSFVKCKKKLIIEEDFNPYVGKKSLFHSLRIIIFGIQIAKFGSIVNYSEANDYLYEIVTNDSLDWEDYKLKYQPIYNSLKSKFRELVPIK